MSRAQFVENFEKVSPIIYKTPSLRSAAESKTLQEFYAVGTTILNGFTTASEEDKTYFSLLIIPPDAPISYRDAVMRITTLPSGREPDVQSQGTGAPAPSTDDSHIDKGVRPPYGTTSVLDVDTLFDTDTATGVFVLPPGVDFSVTEATAPGVMSKQQLKRLSPSITALCEEVWGTTDSKSMAATMLGIGQVIAMAMTSQNTKSDDVEPAVITMDGKEGIFTHGRVRKAITEPFVGSSVQNPMRRFTRAISPSIIYWMTAGLIKPNTKLMAKWGVPVGFYAYAIDGVIPDAGRDGLSAVLAKMFSTIIALKQSQSLASKTIHNALEQSSGGLSVMDKL
ncbi:coat protein [Yam asymptomatic virus 1]|uniref:Coat protein n=1 Tax=Yam asymptomatic virus 1 TaxID=2771210 RepID=A0A7H1JMH9_9CLOS|nr:coat protein [Yam asymptomatic virus 1]QNT12726.1 coat protein [Yam asymptomatic virus 1]